MDKTLSIALVILILLVGSFFVLEQIKIRERNIEFNEAAIEVIQRNLEALEEINDNYVLPKQNEGDKE